jgi:gliding motility-associated-like protein
MKKSILFILSISIFLLAGIPGRGQVPVLEKIDPASTTVNETITLTGNHFSNNPEDMVVHFGAVKGQIISSNTNAIEVIVPPGATYENIKVTNIKSRLTGTSPQPFLLSFGGKDFDTDNLEGLPGLNTASGLFDVCACDLDGDGKPDLVATSRASSAIQIFRNISQGNHVEFASPVAINLSGQRGNDFVHCKDMTGNGKPDIIFMETGTLGSTIHIYKNASTPGNIHFPDTHPQSYGSQVINYAIEDINKDGKQDLIVARTGGEIIMDLNISNGDNLNFDRKDKISFPFEILNLEVADLNQDGLPEIIVSSGGGTTLSILENKSTLNQTTFNPIEGITKTTNFSIPNRGIKAIDINQDGKTDILISDNTNSKLGVFINQSQKNQSPKFALIQEFATSSGPRGIEISDINGDGKPDVLVTSLLENKINIFLNTSKSTGNMGFDRRDLNTGVSSLFNKSIDINGDGKPDILYAVNGSSQIGIFRNTNCVRPKIKNGDYYVVCQDKEGSLTATKGISIEYEWLYKKEQDNKNPNVFSEKSKDNYTITLNQDGYYVLKTTSENGKCLSTDETEFKTLNPNIPGGNQISWHVDGTKFCPGDSVKIMPRGKYLSYKWTPGGETTPLIYAKVPGVYAFVVQVEGGCDGQNSIEIKERPVPELKVSSNTDFVFPGQSVELSASGAAMYFWTPEELLDDPNSDTPKARVDETTTFTVKGIGSNGCSSKESITITAKGEIDVKPHRFFSPNNDGINDFWLIENIDDIPGCAVQIFSANGKLVWENPEYKNNEENAWNGEWNGRPLPDGVYFFRIKCSSRDIKKSGSVTILR